MVIELVYGVHKGKSILKWSPGMSLGNRGFALAMRCQDGGNLVRTTIHM